METENVLSLVVQLVFCLVGRDATTNHRRESVKGDGEPGQEQQGSGWQRSAIGTDSGVGNKKPTIDGGLQRQRRRQQMTLVCIVVIVDNDYNRVLGISPLELQ